MDTETAQIYYNLKINTTFLHFSLFYKTHRNIFTFKQSRVKNYIDLFVVSKFPVKF